MLCGKVLAVWEIIFLLLIFESTSTLSVAFTENRDSTD